MRSFFWGWIKKILFLWDAESAHRWTVRWIRWAGFFGRYPLIWVSGARQLQPQRTGKAWNLSFSSRVGLAAGFDKDAEILEYLPALGFGFAEIGTVTPRPQPGNEKPRLFRHPQDFTLFNRMGFNNAGSRKVAERVGQARTKLPENFRVGINLGKNADTPLESADEDYVLAASPFEGLADYLVINVSSPNTQGLRSLQTLEALQKIVSKVKNRILSWKNVPPLLLKLSPEFASAENEKDFASLLSAAPGWGVEGWVLTNTLAGEFRAPKGPLSGGWSGSVLTQRSFSSLQIARKVTELPIISVGGILSIEEAKRRVQNGASLIQLYTGWIYHGPRFPVQVAQALDQC